MEQTKLINVQHNIGTCVFCPIQCKFGFDHESKNKSKLGYDFSYAKGLCNKGLFNRLLVNHPLRVKSPYYCGNRISYLQSIRLLEPILNEKTAILISGNITLDETIILGSFVNSLGSRNLAMISPIDNKISHFKNRFSYNTFVKAKNAKKGQYFVITIGDIFNNNPVMAKYILESTRKPPSQSTRNFHINISSNFNRTSQFSDISITQKPENILYFINSLKDSFEGTSMSTENSAFDEDITNILEVIKNSEQGVILYAPQYGEFANSSLLGSTLQSFAENVGANLNGGCDFCGLSVGTNSRGIYRILSLAGMSSLELICEKIENGLVENVILVGCNYKTSIPFVDFGKIKNVVYFSSFASKGIIDNNLVIPHKLLFEKKGTLLNLEDKLFDTNPVYYRDSSLSVFELTHELKHTTTKPTKMDIAKILSEYEQPCIEDVPFKVGEYIAYSAMKDKHLHDDSSITSLVRKHDGRARVNPILVEKLNLLNNKIRINNLYEIDFKLDDIVPENQIILPGFDEISRQVFGLDSNAIAVTLSKSVTPLMNKTINQSSAETNNDN